MERVTPEVDAAAEFFEIASDFRDPRDAVREAISNAFDAKAKLITIEARIEKYQGEDELVLEFKDDGEGMVVGGEDTSFSTPSIKAFFDLGHSTRRTDQKSIGKKGHGTKTYFNSRRIEVWTRKDRQEIYALMDQPRGSMAQGQIPAYDYDGPKTSADDPDWKQGTRIIIYGYNPHKRTQGFGHKELRDFILWFTKFGSVEKELGHQQNQNVKLKLKGLGGEWEPLDFSHKFAEENFDIRKLKKIDPASPTKYFVKKWAQAGIPVKGFPQYKMDIVFYIEGDNAKGYNPMIRRRRKTVEEGMYAVEERYGLWACKDFIPVQNVTEWISEGQRVAYTKYHGFVNCQEFRLTANRGDIGNTPHELLNAVRESTWGWFQEKVLKDQVYLQYQEELEREDIYREPKQELDELNKRKKLALNKKICRISNKKLVVNKEIHLIEPKQEAGVFALFCMLKALNPEIFNFHIIDYDTRKGYDALAEVEDKPHLGKGTYKFVEFKKTLEIDFNHSFDRLATIICWDCNLGDGAKIADIMGKERTLKITPKAKTDHTKYMLVSDTEEHNIEVFVLKDYLPERCNIEFRPRTAE